MLVNGPRKIKNYIASDQFIVDVGSGPERLGKEFINVDVFPFPEVDIVADASVLPFADNSIPAMVSESMLEHVAEANSVAKEMVRSLKPGGYLYVSVPFIHPYHASPDDFNRWTLSGLKYMFKELQIVEAGVRSGPWSAVIMFMAYWLGVILSLGNRKVAPFISHFLMLFMGPFKFLDFLFYWIPGSDAVATHVYIIAKK
jgi:SAM-dependent methyltransferase